MSPFRTSLFVLIACARSHPVHAQSDDPLAAIEKQQQALFDQLAPSVVYVSTSGGIGSGFFVDAKGTILTNRHVVGKNKTVDVVLHDGRKFLGRVIERGKKIDLALVRIGFKSSRPLRLSPSKERVGSWVGSIGHGLGGSWTFTTGMVSNIYPTKDKKSVFQTQLPLNPGNSGGPIFDRSGRVVGIVTAGITAANNINFAIRIDEALVSLQRLPSACECLVIDAPNNTPIFVDGKMLGKGPQLVLPAEHRTYNIFAIIRGQRVTRKITFPTTKRIHLRR